MNVAAEIAFDIVPLSRHIGAEIRGLDLREQLDAAAIRRIKQAWLDHSVIAFSTVKGCRCAPRLTNCERSNKSIRREISLCRRSSAQSMSAILCSENMALLEFSVRKKGQAQPNCCCWKRV